MGDNFVSIPCSKDNLDLFIIRTSILEALNENLPSFEGRLLDIGCGKMPYRQHVLGNSKVSEYVGLDIEGAKIYDENIRPDFVWDGITMPFPDNSFDCAFGTEVLEHCPEPEVILKEAFRILKPGGIFFFTTPFLWNLHEIPHDEYRYTPFSLARHLANSGFNTVSIKPTGGWNASLAQMLALWVRRSPMGENRRSKLSWMLAPVIRFLLKKDIKPHDFSAGHMITGLYGTAVK